MNVLVINAGSSSLKYQLMDPDSEKVLAKGLCERIGIDGKVTHKVPGRENYCQDLKLDTHSDAIKAVVNLLIDPDKGVLSSMSEIDAVGHRVVHGSELFSDSILIDEKVLKAIEECVPLAPLHNPPNLIGINACSEVMGNIPQVAVFDTAFHQTMPPKSFIYPIPYEYYTKYRIRHYGFHGTSHKYVSQRAAAMLNRPLSTLKLVSCHLGNGSSVAAIKYGESLDTSMGFTPLAGLPMGTRSGDIDAGIIEFIMNHDNVDITEMLNILNKKSGVLGISGVSSDFRDLTIASEQGNERSKLALDIFNYSVKKYVGSYAAAMSGVDAVIFTAGVGENDSELREDVISGLEYMGLCIDREKNAARSGEERDISTAGSPARILVIPTNEELMIARDTVDILRGKK